MKVKCINSKNKPSDFPSKLWVKEGNIYTVIEAFKDMHGTIALILDEIDLDGMFPYQGFSADRFRELTPDEKLELEREDELVKELLKEEILFV